MALASAVALLGGSMAVATPAVAASANSVTVDLNATTGEITHGATGFLYGLADDGVPSDTLLNGLTSLHTTVGRAPGGAQHPNGDAIATADQWKRNGGGDIQIYMKDYYSQWGYEAYSGSMEEDYVPKIEQMVNAVNESPYAQSFVYVPFNEPDYNDANYNKSDKFDALLEDWDTAYRTIKTLDPDARIAGLNFAVYDSAKYEAFLKHAVENDTVPDIVTWHELDGAIPRIYEDIENWRALEDEYLGVDSDLPISINEYAKSGGDEQVQPGTLVQYISRFETAGVSAALPYWYPAGDLDWLATHNNQATGSWWLYSWYGQMKGQLLEVAMTDRDQSMQALAAYDESTRQTRVLFGGDTSSTLTLNGLSSRYADGAHVTVYGVDATAKASNATKDVPEASDGPYRVAEYNISGDDATLELSGLNRYSAYYAIVTPGRTADETASGLYEAEYARVSGEATPMYEDGSDISGVGYVQGYDGADADTAFFVTAEKDGYYDLSVRYSSASDARIVLKLNRQDAVELELPGTGGSDAWGTAVARVYMPLGINQVDLTGGTYGIKVDSLEVLAADDDAVRTYEAESGYNDLEGAARVEGNIVSYIGNGEGNTLRFNNIEAAEEGDYTITFAYAHNEYTNDNEFQIVNRWADVTVNDDSSTTQRVVFANTRDWNDFWTTSIRVCLKEGSNTVMVGNATGYAPNLDYITVAKTAAQTSAKPDADPGTQPADKAELNKVIEQAKRIDADGYTSESYAALKDSLTKAEAILAKDDASQDEVDAAVAALRDGIGGLKEIVSGYDGQSGSDTSDLERDDRRNLGDTGTAVAGILSVAVVLIASGTVMLLWRKRSV
ncbi:carbohydrate-binding protein [Bifidobacterium lemurum]|uniref:carbohydrate-binding protein n=1 Tax=Bifidobacterium lemurum TaxID=1603886 RepID=UPI001356577A|nr:carbohydrate-binding protein [Bifidobacterium lemurum]